MRARAAAFGADELRAGFGHHESTAATGTRGASPKWQGQCPNCSAWNTLQETLAEPRRAARAARRGSASVSCSVF
ncbi:MAG TPA: hypothetical protein VM491_09580, partial [Burkholderiaceae bacterium]|nr:hypothetical protein [Burkholderiaceae bacterium]